MKIYNRIHMLIQFSISIFFRFCHYILVPFLLVNIFEFTLKLCRSFSLSWVSGDKLVGEASRIVVAEACIQALDIDFTEGQAYEINSVEVSFQDSCSL